MTEITVVGGVYREICAFPAWDHIYGSGGRAAAALSGHVSSTKLHTATSPAYKDDIETILGSFGIDLSIEASEKFFEFEYLHPLSDPIIRPRTKETDSLVAMDVESEVTILFGMMESVPRVSASMCVYDPQSPTAPTLFSESGSTADRLAIICNTAELTHLTGGSGEEHAKRLIESEGAEIVVVKRGLQGATVYSRGHSDTVPAYESASSFLIGSGDIFTSAFALAWAILGLDAVSAADYASKTVSIYCATRQLPIPSLSDMEKMEWKQATPVAGNIYLAGPFREIYQRFLIDEARRYLSEFGMEVFSPVHDIGRGPAEKVVPKDLNAIQNSDIVFAILNGSSPGTLFEVGYAVALGKPVYCLAENMREQDIKLPMGAGCKIYSDLVTAITKAVIRA